MYTKAEDDEHDQSEDCALPEFGNIQYILDVFYTTNHPYCSATGSSPGTTALPPAASIFALADFVKP